MIYRKNWDVRLTLSFIYTVPVSSTSIVILMNHMLT